MNYLHHVVLLDAIAYNYEVLSSHTTSTVGAVIKANAYGHGAIDVAHRLEDCGCTLFFTGTVQESCIVRAAGIKGTIFPLLGITSDDEVKACQEYQLIPVVHTKEQLELLRHYKNPIAIKCDTGMSRLGFALDDFDILIHTCSQYGLEVGYLFSHLSTSEDRDSAYKQKKEFDAMYELARSYYPSLLTSLGNSSSIEHETAVGYDIVRTGIALYGYTLTTPSVKPAMEIYTKILQIRSINSGRAVSYNNTFVASHSMRVASVACGYADGYARHSRGSYMMIEGVQAPIIGTICMQSCVVDISHIENVTLQSKAYLLQPSMGLDADTIAKSWGSIPFEVLCALGKRTY